MKKLIFILTFFLSMASFGQVLKMQVDGKKGITTSQRDALNVPAGEFWEIYNTTTTQREFWDGDSWEPADAPAGAEVNDLTAAVTWANVPNANITQSSVIQYEAALSISKSQFSDLNIEDTAYGAGWDADTDVATKNAIYDKIETLGGSQLTQEQVEDFAFDNARFGAGVRTLIATTYDDVNNQVDFVVENDLSLYDNTTSNFSTTVGTVTSVTGGVGLSSTGGTTPSIALTVDELAEKTGDLVGTDRLTGTSSTTNFSETISNVPLSIFNNDNNWNNYSHPNHTGEVTSVGDGALTITNDAVTYAKIQNVANDERILGRVSGANGDIEELTNTQVITMLGITPDDIPDRTLVDATVTTTQDLDYDLYEQFDFILTGAVTFTESNIYNKILAMDCTGDFAITYPSGWSTNISGTYDGTVQNTIIIWRIASGVYKIQITQPD